ncbi:amidohydrolase [Acidiplasma aeolicum]|jgi:predicted amidohydrolase YtcJ|uniref:amidohydrolase n=1 Tax=Acidiplasma aeolicum TaxID=507754 RepID=UPI0037119088
MKYKILLDNFFDGYEFKKGLFSMEINEGKIESVNEINKINTYESTSPEILDLRGKIITPGIIDSHNHFTMTALKMKYQIDLGKARSISDIINTIKKNSNKMHKGWILGYNLNEFQLKEKRMPDINDLDKLNLKIPVFITHFSEHYAICNSEAIHIGNNDTMSNPSGGIIGRDASGNINGILYEPSAMDLIKSKIPEYSIYEYEEAISYASEQYLKSGITAVKDIGGTGKDIDEELRIEALNEVDKNGELKIKVGISIPVFSFNDAYDKLKLSDKINNSDNLKFTGFKMFLDGSGLSRNAWMNEVWNKNYIEVDKNNYGHPLWDIDEFKKTLRYLSQADNTISIHAIGDRAIKETINSIIDIKKTSNTKANYAIVHCTSPSQEDLLNMKLNNISVETQGAFIYFFGNEYIANFGKSREHRLFPFREMFDMGINMCNGSDSPVTLYKPIYGIISSISREMKTSNNKYKKLNPDQSLTLEETLKSFTINCASVMGWYTIGALKVGSKADIVVWNNIPMSFETYSDDFSLINIMIYNGQIYKL